MALAIRGTRVWKVARILLRTIAVAIVEVVVLVCGAPADDPSAVTGPAAAMSMLSRW